MKRPSTSNTEHGEDFPEPGDDTNVMDRSLLPSFVESIPTLREQPSPFHPGPPPGPPAVIQGPPPPLVPPTNLAPPPMVHPMSPNPPMTPAPPVQMAPPVDMVPPENLAPPVRPIPLPAPSTAPHTPTFPALAGIVAPDTPQVTFDGPTTPDALEGLDEDDFDEMPTLLGGSPRRKAVAAPEELVEVSRSLHLEAASLEKIENDLKEQREARLREQRRHPVEGPGAALPTYVLPAMKVEPREEGSDLPMILGLAALGVLILALLTALIVGLLAG